MIEVSLLLDAVLGRGSFIYLTIPLCPLPPPHPNTYTQKSYKKDRKDRKKENYLRIRDYSLLIIKLFYL